MFLLKRFVEFKVNENNGNFLRDQFRNLFPGQADAANLAIQIHYLSTC